LKLSPKQRKAWAALIEHPLGPAELATILETSPEGAAATASSLVRHKIAVRERTGGHVIYRAVKQ
jgi:predicted carbohydrate-binding protein with CBM5 and CBM33 domain